jgi:hypothetical protein
MEFIKKHKPDRILIVHRWIEHLVYSHDNKNG